MARYFFNIHDGYDFFDDQGVELNNWDEARQYAIRLAGNVIVDSALTTKLGENWSMDVTDLAGLILFRLDFHISGSPAVTAIMQG